jgi:arylsulfatase A-like enzyme
MDDAVGRVLDKVRALDQESQTLMFFIADNGGPTQGTTSQNGGLNGFKMTTYEGGPRVPFLVQWKGVLPAGKNYDLPVLNLDVLPTALAAAGQTTDPAWKLDGVNLLPYLRGENTGRPHETLYWRFGEQWAVRHGDWKLVKSRGGGDKPELYNLAEDRNESKNRAAEHPDTVTTLQKLWDTWSAQQAPPSSVDQPATPKKNKAKKKAAT